MENKKVQILMKILTEEKHCENMLNGNILFSPFDDFNKIKDGHARGDKYDGQEYILDPQEYILMIGDRPVEGLKDKILISKQSVTKNRKICSFYLLETFMDYTVLYDDEIFSLGDFCVVITQPREFIDRVKETIDTMYPSTFQYGTCKYVNMDTFNGFYGNFKKPNSYRWQNEVRMLFESSNTGKEFIKIGNINDIAVIYRLEDFLKFFRRL